MRTAIRNQIGPLKRQVERFLPLVTARSSLTGYFLRNYLSGDWTSPNPTTIIRVRQQ